MPLSPDSESPSTPSPDTQKKKEGPKKTIENKSVQQRQTMIKTLVWLLITPLVLMGHFYCTIFILVSASYFYKEVLSMFRVLRKEKEIEMTWLDWFWYTVGAYWGLPRAFNRNKIHTIESKTIQTFFYQYHSLICNSMIFLGCFLTVFKLNRGFVKYQLRRQMWVILTLCYVFMLSFVQVYNLYVAYIWVLCPIISVRANSFVTKRIFTYFSRQKDAWHKYLPNQDLFSAAIGLITTGVFAFLFSGFLAMSQHLVCRQDQLTIRVFETKTCTIDQVYERQGFIFTKDFPYLQQVASGWQMLIRPVQLHLTLIALVSCFIAPMMRFAAGTVQRAFGIKEDLLTDTLGRESGLTDVFYCHGMVGVFVMIYLHQIVFRERYYFEMAMFYVKLLSYEDKQNLIFSLTNSNQ